MSYLKKKKQCDKIKSENSSEEGSHWAAYYKNNDKKYFDSYGNVYPPKQLVKYLGLKNLFWNYERFQNYNDPPCHVSLCGGLLIL